MEQGLRLRWSAQAPEFEEQMVPGTEANLEAKIPLLVITILIKLLLLLVVRTCS